VTAHILLATMKNIHVFWCGALLFGAPCGGAASSQVLAWNNLGMHCMDSDYSVFSILPPYNTIEAQLIVSSSPDLGVTSPWQWVATPPTASGGRLQLTVPAADQQFYRVIRPW